MEEDQKGHQGIPLFYSDALVEKSEKKPLCVHHQEQKGQ